jgi:radical SAM superfamily enzyme YgiQ (UPF0313 family)
MLKNILLIQPENEEINRFRRKQFNNFTQLTVPYLAGFIDEKCYNITLVDEYNGKIPFHLPFDLIAITVNTPNASHCYRISDRFREKGAKVVMGGPHATLLPDETKKHCDYLLMGECEDTWPQFLNDFHEGIAKALYKPEKLPDLTNLPAPRWDLVKRRKMMKGAVFATRGCPYHCRYCNLKQIYGDTFRTRPVDEVIREIGLLPSGFFVFWDDNLFADKQYAKKLLNALIPLKKKWAAQVTMRDCMDNELLEIARDAGCLYLFIGLESFSEQSLHDAGKPINKVEDYRTVIDTIHRYKIMVQAGIVFGFDSDTTDIFDTTLKACERIGIDGVTVSILTPFPKTPLYQQLESEGRLISHDWHLYNSKTHVTFTPKRMSVDELFSGYMRFRKKFYSLRSFIKRMRKSKTHTGYNFFINSGYWLSIRSFHYIGRKKNRYPKIPVSPINK